MQSLLITLEALSQISKINIDTRSIIKKYALNENFDKKIILNILKDEGYTAKVKDFTLDKLDKYPLPAICFKNNEYFLILKKDNERIMILNTRSKKTEFITFKDLHENIELFIVLKHNIISDNAKFGFNWFFKQMLQYKKILSDILITSFIIQLFALVTPLFSQVILDKVLVHQNLSTLNVITFAFLFVLIFDFILNIIRNYIFNHTTSKIDSKLGSQLFYHLLTLPISYFENRKVGNIIAKVRELDQIREFVANKSVTLILDILFSFVFIIIMFIYSVKLTFITLFFISVIAILYFIFTPILRKKLELKFQMSANSNSYLVESVTGIQTVKSLSIEGNMNKKWDDYLSKYVDSNFNLTNLNSALSAVSNLLQKLMTLSILYFGVLLVIEKELSVGQLIAFQMFANQFSSPIMRLVNLWNEFQQTLLSVDRLGDILNSPTENENKNAISLSNIKGDIKFENIYFKYNENNMVLNNFNLNIKSGESIGIVGKSGSGKSTLTKLIQRLYIANEGSIFIDNIDIKHLNINWLRQNIGVVLQENYLFSGTIRENIEFSMPGIPMEYIIKVANIAGADEFIKDFPEGYETIVGERGSSLSGGQKQRIAIARALLANPKILIFDEATSALDYESERIVQDNMNLIKKDRTIFIVAHRLSTVKNCDRIIVLDKGIVIEEGTHEYLINKKGYYYKLYSNQSEIR